MGHRPDEERSRVLLIGAGHFQTPDLDDIDAVGPGLDRLRSALTGAPTGVFSADPERLRALTDPATPRQVFDAFFQAAETAEDVLLVYYAGHGLLDRFGKLHLAVRESDPHQPVGNAVEFSRLKQEMEAAPAATRILILDCCYSGQAVGRQSTTTPTQAAAQATAQVIDNAPVTGMYVLTSADHQSESRFVRGEPTTAFTGALLRALQPQEHRATELRELYPRIEAELARRDMPTPQTTSGNSSGDLVVRLPGDHTLAAPPPSPPPPNPGRRSRVAVAVATAGIIATIGFLTSLNGGQGSDGTPTTQPPLPTTPPTTTVAETADVVFTDDFSNPTLDPQKWKPSNKPDIIRPADGHLLMSVRPGAGVDEARLSPTTLPRPFTDVRFTLTIPPYAHGGQGGGAFVVNPDSAQPQILTFGPSPSGASIYPITCDRPRCRLGVYDDFTEASDTNVVRVTYDKTIAVEIVRRDGRLQFLADGIPIGASAIDPGPLTGFRFNATAGGAESWDVQIDDLVVQ